MQYTVLCVATVFLSFCETLPALPHDARILRSTESELVVELVPAWTVDTLEVSGARNFLFSFPGAIFPAKQSPYQIPFSTFSIGVPKNGLVFCEIVDSGFEVVEDCEIALFPNVTQADESISSAPAAGAWFPQFTVTVGEPYRFRDQRMTRISIPMLRISRDARGIRKYNRVQLRIRFSGAERGSGQLSAGATEEALYRSVVFNYDQSRKWRFEKEPYRSGALLKSNLSGSFFTFRIGEEAMYKLDGAAIQPHMRLEDIVPAKIRLFNNGGNELPRDPNAPRPSGLLENTILVEDGGDGRFDREDFIAFYARGTTNWKYDTPTGRFQHITNRYETGNLFWLNIGGDVDGKRMSTVMSPEVAAPPIEEYTGLAFFEDEVFNPLNSGMNWFSRKFDSGFKEALVHLDIGDGIPASEALLRARFASVSADSHHFDIRFNQQPIGRASLFGEQYFGLLSDYFKLTLQRFEFPVRFDPEERNEILIRHSHRLDLAQAFLDWVELEYRAQSRTKDDKLLMWVLPKSERQSYRVSGTNGDSRVFDVTRFDAVELITPNEILGNELVFSVNTEVGVSRRFAIAKPEAYGSVSSVQRASFVDLRTIAAAGEFLIITHDEFLPEAIRLKQHRENGRHDNQLRTEVVTVTDIYNTFSGGLVDPTAIRDFIRYAYDTWEPRPSYVLLFGDGSYDFKQKIVHEQTNWIPSFQTEGERADGVVGQLESRAMDVWFTYLSAERQMWLAIGRIPVNSLEEAKAMVDKIIEYESEPVFEPWRQTMTFVADDEFVTGQASSGEMRHVRQSESIASSLPARFDVQKIFTPEYPKMVGVSSGGIVRPSAKEAIIAQLNQGTVVMNYIGHGNPDLWAHEYIFLKSDNTRVQNPGRLPFFVAATCDWGLYDDPLGHRQAEDLLLANQRGCIGVLGSSRDVYSDQNARINGDFYRNLFTDPDMPARIGQAMLASFGRIRDDHNLTNDEKFHILGDPTLKLAFPRNQATIGHLSPDSIVALTRTELSGTILRDGESWSEFEGKVLVNVLDSKRSIERDSDVAGNYFKYELPGNSIYRGIVPVVNGEFRATFIVPKDLSYGGSKARATVYFWNDETDGNGFLDEIRVSNRSDTTLHDVEGPEIRIYFDGVEDFETEDIIPDDVTLVMELADQKSGINIAGDLGHRITLKMTPEQDYCLSEFVSSERAIDLTDYFVFDEGEYLRGKVRYPLRFPRTIERNGQTISCSGPDGLEKHTLELKAWDNANNSSTLQVILNVSHEQGLAIHDLLNYPNPFARETSFAFYLTQDADVQIKIYSIAGRLIRVMDLPFGERGFNVISWDGQDAYGDELANGVYLYKVSARSQGVEAERVERIGRVAVLR